MKSFRPNDLFEVKLGESTRGYDVIFVPIDGKGSLGQLNRFVLKSKGLNESITGQLNLLKGFDVYSGKGFLIVFIVTIDYSRNNLPIELLKINLLNALKELSGFIIKKNIWIPLMGTGVAGLSYSESYKIQYEIITDYQLDVPFNVVFSIPDDSEGVKLFEEMNMATSLEYLKEDDFMKLEAYILKNSIKFYIVGTIWDRGEMADAFYKEGYWENGYGSSNEKFATIVDNVKPGDFLVHKSTYAKKGDSILRIKGFGVVTQNPKNGTKLEVDWLVKDIQFDVSGLGHYRETIQEASLDHVNKIISGITATSVRENIIHQIQSYQLKPTTEISTWQEQLANISSDSDRGADSLNIMEDVKAFARVIAADSFTPPLAIALFGEWGSGKSFFMKQLKGTIEGVSNNPKKVYCTGIAHIEFNAWSYMDANLWASLTSKIFQGLNAYIKDHSVDDEAKRKIEKKLTKDLNITKVELLQLEEKEQVLKSELKVLDDKKVKLASELKGKIKQLRRSSVVDVLEGVKKQYKYKEKLAELQKLSSKDFANFVPEDYQDDPEKVYEHLNTITTYMRMLFSIKDWWKHILLILFIGGAIYLGPMLGEQLDKMKVHLSDIFIQIVPVASMVLARLYKLKEKFDSYIAPFWKLKKEYNDKKEAALYKLEQWEKALKFEIEKKEKEILLVEGNVIGHKKIQSEIQYKIEHALSTEALMNFIDKRAGGSDYKQHLGIISTVRQDLETLNTLLAGHREEQSVADKEFKKLFKNQKSLQRIILYVDDLDRCPEQKVVEVLEAVNLLMAYPLFVVVVGVDPRWVKNALYKQHFAQFSHVEADIGIIEPLEVSNYLEKIFQVPYNLKKPEEKDINTMISNIANVQALPLREEINKEDGMLIGYQGENEPERGTPEPSKPEIIVDTKSEEDLVKELILTKKEVESLQYFSVLIGGSPRLVKRYLNVYRILKTHKDLIYKEEEGAIDDALLVLIFMLALSIGPYKNNLSLFKEAFDNGDLKDTTLQEFLKTAEAEVLPKDIKILLEGNDQIKVITLSGFSINYELLKRFTINGF
ncbi:hypothetical protein NBRC110019_01040 [Neptunitalea chrysea]|uniref:KAP NTPase domain-containing protein n=1 Tax=Neptunitalea chrysea TaxID=1647581 RepID=A0A9W6ET38_9FLAO|nr:P-loop NTPase fold protein [Neptunitalea chrysea]GLB51065.1 hypothetical protein NBRC110019_01040 [Neptunitalea chrysea]